MRTYTFYKQNFAQVASNVNFARDKAKEKVLRTQGKVLQAQEKVTEKVAKTLDKVPFGEAIKSALPPAQQEGEDTTDAGQSSAEGQQRPTTPNFMQHSSADDHFRPVDTRSLVSAASSDELSVATSGGPDKQQAKAHHDATDASLEFVQDKVSERCIFSLSIESIIQALTATLTCWL